MSQPPPSTRGLPRAFGRYVLFDEIGEGGMARIFLGREPTELGGERRVVVKQILPLLSSSPEFSQLLIAEAKLAAKLTHGNVVQVYDLGREGESLYIAMEYVEGFDLRDLLKQCSQRKVPLPVEFSLLIVSETLRALDYAHRKKGDDGKPLGIVHRDVSPSNVLVAFDGQIKLCDFGIARAMGETGALPDAAIQGKAGYMSPEAARGAPPDARSDVYAAGAILWELLAGRRLLKGEGGKPPTLEQARNVEVPPLPTRNLAQEATLQAIVARAVAREPEQRFASARAMLKELEGYVAASGMVASPLKLGEWLTQHFAAEILERRRAREAASRRETLSADELDSLSATEAPTAPVEPTPAPPSEAAPSLVALASTVKESSPPAEPKSRAALVWIVIAVAALAVIAAALLR